MDEVTSERGREALYIGCVYMLTDSKSFSVMDSGYDRIKKDVLKARSHCTLNAHSIRFNVHWFAFTLSRRECALSQSGLKPVWLNPLREVV